MSGNQKWVLVAGAVFGACGLLYLALGGDSHEGGTRLGADEASATVLGGNGVAGDGPVRVQAAAALLGADAGPGIALRAAEAPSTPAQAGSTTQGGSIPTPDLPRSAELGQQSAGYRLGTAQAQTLLAEERIRRLQAKMAEFQEQGRPDLAARQAQVTERFDARLRELQAQIPELRQQAQSDGTLGDVQAGLEAAAGGGEGADGDEAEPSQGDREAVPAEEAPGQE